MTPSTATVSYKWTLNGKGTITTSTYTVPADANSGDAIKLVVTDADGNTAEDTVYVGGFTILLVEPTTASTQPQRVGYKYIRADFSASLSSLTPSDIEIRDKKSNQLYSVESVTLSSDGTSADITIAGNSDIAGTSFLVSQTEYVITITQGGASDSYEFELPDYQADMLVTSVNLKDGKITIGTTDRTNSGTAVGSYEVGDVYDDNLGSLVGRTVNVGINSDNELETISVNDAEVVYGVMKYVEKGGFEGVPSAKDYFEDVVTGTKYYLSANSSSKINTTQVINVVNGNDLIAYTLDENGDVNDAPELTDDATYVYTKLVLNPNGTVSCAVLDDQLVWVDYIRVTDVDENTVNESGANAFDFKDYTIEKDGEYITPADLEEDDIIYFESENKFAEVYNNVVSGTPSGINSNTIKVNGTALKWAYAPDVRGILGGTARYYDTDDEAYEPLANTDEDDNIDSQKYLASLDTELGVDAYLNRLGQIVYIDGVVTGTSATTDEYYVTTSGAKGYNMALKDYIQFKVSDGKEQTIEIPVSQIKKFNGIAGKLEAGDAQDTETEGAYLFKFTASGDDDSEDFTDTAAEAFITTGQFVKLTKDSSGKVIGITFVDAGDGTGTNAYVAGEGVKTVTDIDDKGEIVLKPSSEKLTTNATTVAKLTDETNIWVHSRKLKANNTDVDKTTVTKTTFADYTKTTRDLGSFHGTAIGIVEQATGAANLKSADASINVFVKGSNVTDLVIIEKVTDGGVSNAFAVADKTSAAGIVVDYTTKKNGDEDLNYVDTITIKEIDGTEVEYEASVEDLGLPEIGTYIDLTLDKNTEEIVAVKSNAWSYVGWLDTAKNYTKLTQIIDEDAQKIEADKTALIVKRSYNSKGEAEYKNTTLNQINTSTKAMTIEVHQAYYNDDDGIIYGDFIVVEEMNAATAEAYADAWQDIAGLSALTLNINNAADTTKATVTVSGDYGTVSAGAKTLDPADNDDTWTVDGRVATFTSDSDADGAGTVVLEIEGDKGSMKRVVTFSVAIKDGEANEVVLTKVSDTYINIT